MKRVGATFLFLLGVSSAWAQVPIPGTFTSQTSQPGVIVSGPILTPPLVSFGSGLTPPVVVNGQAAIVSAPESTSAQPSMIMDNQRPPMPGYVSTGRVLGMAAKTNAAEAPAAQASAQSTAYFDFVVAPSSGSSSGLSAMASGVKDTDLGKVAASLRKGAAPAKRSFTNEDIARLNGVTNNDYPMPGASTDQPAYPQQQPYSESTMQSEPTQLAHNTMPQQPAAQQQQSEQSNSAASNQQSEKTSPSSAIASTRRRLPASSSPLPLIAMLGAVALGVGYILAKRR